MTEGKNASGSDVAHRWDLIPQESKGQGGKENVGF